MRDLLFKNLTSQDHRRRIITSAETSEKEGVRSIIRRHFICSVKEVTNITEKTRALPYVYVLKKRNTHSQSERFFCKIKSNLLAVHEGRLFLINFMHTLNIMLQAVEKEDLV
jgi:hypothetical protein